MNPDVAHSLDGILEYAVTANWGDLVPVGESGVIHVDYRFTKNSIDGLKVWSATARGHWLLACQYWMSAGESRPIGIRFENGYSSSGLARVLDLIMQHQSAFSPPTNLGRDGLLQVHTPTAEESSIAVLAVAQTSERINSQGCARVA